MYVSRNTHVFVLSVFSPSDLVEWDPIPNIMQNTDDDDTASSPRRKPPMPANSSQKVNLPTIKLALGKAEIVCVVLGNCATLPSELSLASFRKGLTGGSRSWVSVCRVLTTKHDASGVAPAMIATCRLQSMKDVRRSTAARRYGTMAEAKAECQNGNTSCRVWAHPLLVSRDLPLDPKACESGSPSRPRRRRRGSTSPPGLSAAARNCC